MLYDCHLHSQYSFDGQEPVEALCQAALQAGLAGITVTDHVELGAQVQPGWRARFQDGYQQALKAARDFAGRLEVFAGVELGQPLEDPAAASQLLGDCGLDFVLLSLHSLPGGEDFYFIDYASQPAGPLLRQYFLTLYQMVSCCDFDSLAHLTYPLRYMRAAGLQAELQAYEHLLLEIFRVLVRREKALEVNTGDLQRPGGALSPQLWELSLYRRAGGRLVTLGSDAHQCAWVGGGLDRAAALLRQAGFRQGAFYRGRQPEFYPLGGSGEGA